MSVPLLAELKRRRVFRALIGYGIAAFAVLQIVEPLMHGLHWPDTVLSYVVVALAGGFPVVITLAWIFDVQGGHLERTEVGRLGARRGLLLAGIGLLAAAPGLIWYFGFRARAHPPPESTSIVVLPFVNLSSDKENEYFSDGVTEDIINALANVEGLRVVARTSAFSFKGKNINVRRIGEELGVATVLEGSVRREGNQLRIVVQLVGAADGYHLWSKTYDRELKNVFSLEDELARAIVRALQPRLVPGSPMVQAATSSMEAHDLYLKGRYFWNLRTKDGLTRAKASFEQAIARDPAYALAHSGLADCYTLLMDYGAASAADVLPQARAYALKAVKLDDALAEAHASLGAVSQHDYDWKTAERELLRAIELRPGYATAHQWLAEILVVKAKFADAVVEAERARQLDPTAPVVNYVLTVTLYMSRDYSRAIEQARRTLELYPSFLFVRIYLVLSYLRVGRLAEALATLDQATGNAGNVQCLRALVLAARGERVAAQRLLAETEGRFKSDPFPRVALAATHLALDDKDGAFAWLEQGIAAKEPSTPLAMRSAVWDPVRADPRFQKLLRRMNLE